MVVIATENATMTPSVNASTLVNILPERLFTLKWVGLTRRSPLRRGS